ncbi:dolichyl-diphosphooligosaccharide---protein glycosyltransferase [Nematocida homosporus]|uniref:dolichyl-diphosphooligosaccharide---protein glycosyltransferase n=1 Tax=Nematocida homosporus TaxID=1912981 RepID=UPI002220CEEE|nr:dolichyl-diphosphooligosaccharide---protein glycosyltransferase [Nematocida homosporus]KAI5185727.1 dolichyl-diphosphooligosaccharide---protein glycosyltransferase [Nematocida homosporus]
MKYIGFEKQLRVCIWWGGALFFLFSALARLYPLLHFGETINEYDPWFNYRCSLYIWENGLRAYWQWKDELTWVPEGRNIPATTYPLLALVSNGVHWLVSGVAEVSHYQVCAIMPVLIFLGESYLLYRLGDNLFADSWRAERKIVCLGLFSLSGGIFEKTIAGAFDYEGLSLYMVLWCILVYSNLLRNKSSKIAAGFYLALIQGLFKMTWGGSLFTEVVIVSLEVLSLANNSYFWIFCVGSSCFGFWLPFLKTIDVTLMGKLGALLFLSGLSLIKQCYRHSRHVLWVLGGCLASITALAAYQYTRILNLVIQVLQRSKVYNLFVKQKEHPLVQSISEHRAPTYHSIVRQTGHVFFLLPLLVLYYTWKHRHGSDCQTSLLLLICLGLSSGMFLKMERFAFLCTPFIALVATECWLDIMRFLARQKAKAAQALAVLLSIGLLVYLVSASKVCWQSTQNVMVAFDGQKEGTALIIDDFREAAMYIRHNTPTNAVFISWWDYGYQITGMTNRATVVDNNTNNYLKIAKVADLLLTNENQLHSHPLVIELQKAGKTEIYFYVVSGTLCKYTLCDLAKLNWIATIAREYNPMIRPEDYYYISGQTMSTYLLDMVLKHPKELLESSKSIKVAPKLKDSFLFKSAYFQHLPEITLSNTKLFFQTTNQLVRIYQLNPTAI